MSTMTHSGVTPDHRARSPAGRTRVNSTTTAENGAVTTAPLPETEADKAPAQQAVTDLSQPTYSPSLGRNLTRMAAGEQIKRDRARQEALERLREVQTRD